LSRSCILCLVRNDMIDIRSASPDDMPFIKECIEKFSLDDEHLDYCQFITAKEIILVYIYNLQVLGIFAHKVIIFGSQKRRHQRDVILLTTKSHPANLT